MNKNQITGWLLFHCVSGNRPLELGVFVRERPEISFPTFSPTVLPTNMGHMNVVI
jgi:hypothetical protein